MPRQPTGRPPGRPRKNPPSDLAPDEFLPEGELQPGMETVDDMVDAEYDQFFSILSGGSVSVVQIWRWGTGSKRREYIETVGADVFQTDDPLAYLRDTYGPGSYNLILRDGSNRRYLGGKVVHIGAKLNKDGPAAGAGGGAFDHVSFMREQMALQQNLLLAMIQNSRGNGGGDLAGIGALLQGMGTFKPAAVDPASMLTAMTTAFQVLNPKREDNGDDASLNRIKTILEITREMRGGDTGKDPDSWLGVVREVGGRAVEVLGSAVQVQNGGPAPRRAELPAQAGAPAQTAAAEGKDVLLLNIKAAIARLKRAGLKPGADPEFWVDYVLETSSEPESGALMYALEQGATWENLLQIDGEIGTNPTLTAFFRGVYDGLFLEVRKQQQQQPGAGAPAGPPAAASVPDGPPAGQTGNAGNT